MRASTRLRVRLCWAGAWLVLSLAAPAVAEARWTITGGTVNLTIDASLNCVQYDQLNPCPIGRRGSFSGTQHSEVAFSVVPGTVTEPYLTSVRLVPTSGTHTGRVEEAFLPFEDGSRCVGADTTTDTGIGNLSGEPSWLAVFQEFTDRLQTLRIVDVASDLDVPGQPTVSSTTTESGECSSGRTDTFDIPLESALGGRVLWGLDNYEVVTDDAPPTVSRCPTSEPCDRTVSGVSRLSARRTPEFTWADGSGSFELSTVMRWSVQVRAGGTPPSGDERPTQPGRDDDSGGGVSFWDGVCGVGDPIAGYGAGLAALVRETPASALGPLGVALGLGNLGCTAFGLWDTPVDDAASAIATGACAGLTSFSFGMGTGSLFLAGTGVGLPAAAIGGMVSIGSGVFASIACSSVGGADSRARAAQASDDFRTVTRPRRVRLDMPRMPHGTSPAVRARLRATVRNTSETLGAHTAMLRCRIRAQAAAAAGEAQWERRQNACAAGNARRVADGFRAQARIHARLARAIRASGIRTPRIDAERARPTRPAVTRQLRRMGASRADVRRLRRVASRAARSTPVPRSLTAALTARAGRRAYGDAARAFDALARKIAR